MDFEADKIRVLMVDDQVMITEAVRRMLALDPKIEFASVRDGAAALRTAEEVRPTVILQDLLMPGTNGLDLLQKYRQSPSLQHVHVIVLSTNEDPAVKKSAFEAGANDYLVKLPDRVELLARVRLHSQAFQQQAQLRLALQALEDGQRVLLQKNAELARLNEQLAEATRFKSEFLANMSHEIRTPLIGVLGMAELLSQSQLAPHQRELIDVIRGSGETLLYILNDILDFSKIESGRLELEAAPFNLRDAVDQTLELLAPLAFGKGLEFSAWVDPTLPVRLVGDPTRFRQVLLNLLNNAIKFTQAGEVHLSLQRSATNPGSLQGCVEDTGIGIPEDKKARLFQVFSQVDATTTRRFGGTGLGLAICRNLLTLMGGRIWVESEVGRGTRFFFQIPLAADPAVHAVSLHDTPIKPRKAVALLRHERILNALTTYGIGLGFSFRTVCAWPASLPPDFEFIFVDYDFFREESLRLTSLNARLVLYTRSRDATAIQQQFPHATVLLLPVKCRHLQSLLGDPEPARLSGEPGASESAEVPAGSLPYRVLVVDDNSINRQVCAAQFATLGVTAVKEAEDGAAAVQMAGTEPFDLIFMDLHMPVMDGLEATRIIRTLPAGERRPFILGLTANALPDVRERCLKAGMDECLVKPVGLSELKRVLREFSPRRANNSPVPSPRAGALNGSASLPVCDRRRINELRQVIGSDEKWRNLVRSFVDQAEALIARLPAVGQDAGQLASEAHKIKGAAGYVCAARLVEICDRVEAAAGRTPAEPDQALLASLKDALTASAETYRRLEWALAPASGVGR